MLFAVLCGSGFPDGRARLRTGLQAEKQTAVPGAQVASAARGEEPASPDTIDRARFAGAIEDLCGKMPAGRALEYAQWIEESAYLRREDPFLLAALVHRMSRCDASGGSAAGIGLTGIQPSMYEDNVRGRVLTYAVRVGSVFVTRQNILSRMLTEATLRTPEANIEWAAALLAMWHEQHEAIDERYEQHAHRHYVSHFVWGDRVQNERAEEGILTDRRRLLLHYGVELPQPTELFRGVQWGSPLEGSPRMVSSVPGASRDAGLRSHRGVDVIALRDEPVFAMADGPVFFAGVDLPGRGSARSMRVSLRRMGHGGRFVCIEHAPAAAEDEAYLRSCYMHLEKVFVQTGELVTRGQLIGTVGRTGMKRSAPHLHLEIKSDKRLYDARDVVPGILVGEPAPEPRPRRRVRARAMPVFAGK